MIRPAAVALLAALAACNKAPPEPEAAPASSAQAPAAAPLVWEAPGPWTKLAAPPTGAKKASYKVEKVGNDKEDAEVDVFYFGSGSKGDPAVVLKEWLAQFDGDGPGQAKRDKRAAGANELEIVEHAGTYKVALAPPPRGRKKAPVQMVKSGHRLVGVAVKTKDRGNWFFRLAGPDETVQSARSAFLAMIEAAR